MYSFVREKLNDNPRIKQSMDGKIGADIYESHKCKFSPIEVELLLIIMAVWVHPENILEIKTYILRRLPVLVYNVQTSKVADSGRSDPSITSLYFDSPGFSLYDEKVRKVSNASSLRLRWYGNLSENPEIQFEKKTVKENGESVETRFPIKQKYIRPYIAGDYKLEKSIEKLRERQGNDENDATQLKKSVDDIQNFIKTNELQPVLRANYTRTAFQIPGDDRVRISLDTDMAFIREDSLDTDRPCRNPEEWHRGNIDEGGMKFPFPGIKQGEISRFPYALLDIKVKGGSTKRINDWVADLMTSHLVKEAPSFSKFVHGVAQLFEDSINSFPFWLSDLEIDIRRDPETAFQEEQEKKAKQAENEQAIGSFLGARSASPFTAAVGSPIGKPTSGAAEHRSDTDVDADEIESNQGSDKTAQQASAIVAGVRSLFPSFSNSKYARAHRQKSVRLPPKVSEPGQLIKDSGPVRVEPKVWLANQRTFIKWQHIAVLLASLSLGLYNAAREFDTVARGLAVIYTLVAVFAGAWGWWQYIVRSRMIQERSGKDFDNTVGPIIVCAGLIVGLCLNFGFQVKDAENSRLSVADCSQYRAAIDGRDQKISASRMHHNSGHNIDPVIAVAGVITNQDL